MRVSMCVGGGGVGGFFHVFCKNLSPSVILNPRSLPPCCSLGHIYTNPVADTHDQIHYTLTQLPSQRWGGGHSTYTVYSCWGTGSAGGYRVIECGKKKTWADVDKVQRTHLARYRCRTRSPPTSRSFHPRFTLRITLQLVLANRCSRLGCRPQHARKQTLIVGFPSIISSPLLLFSPPLLFPERPGEQSRGPNLCTKPERGSPALCKDVEKRRGKLLGDMLHIGRIGQIG